MLTPHVTERTPKKPRGMTLFPGIQQAATEFGVNRITLYRVLKGQFPDNRGLCRRYRAWLSKQQKA